MLKGWHDPGFLNNGAKARIRMEKVECRITLDPESVCGPLSITFLEQSKRSLLVSKLRVAGRQVDRRDIVGLRFKQTLIELPANETARAVPLPNAPQIPG